eukprot:CAMPEP_0170486250 /NCGR_PEP_ID=MMETSP0208-20121228/5308_1 /TAXON_ID=197538 /ORGANISM="Strombidium inclinatum, Strain S3" /LENGTH=82 /DNA_ID=CAMNT_0010760129 /DNA_START=62 /DNA_END=310 /DNA_ORIENTATION=+
MHLQKKDYKAALILQRELAKRCPNDKNIAEFATLLPEFAEGQPPDEDGEESEYYDEESPVEEESEEDEAVQEEEPQIEEKPA